MNNNNNSIIVNIYLQDTKGGCLRPEEEDWTEVGLSTGVSFAIIMYE